jgi:hypothetical protein
VRKVRAKDAAVLGPVVTRWGAKKGWCKALPGARSQRQAGVVSGAGVVVVSKQVVALCGAHHRVIVGVPPLPGVVALPLAQELRCAVQVVRGHVAAGGNEDLDRLTLRAGCPDAKCRSPLLAGPCSLTACGTVPTP